MPPKRSDRLGEQLIGKVPTVEFDLFVIVFYFGFGWARCAMVDSKVSLILKLKLFASIYLATNHAVDKKRSTKIYKPLLTSHTTYSLHVTETWFLSWKQDQTGLDRSARLSEQLWSRDGPTGS